MNKTIVARLWLRLVNGAVVLDLPVALACVCSGGCVTVECHACQLTSAGVKCLNWSARCLVLCREFCQLLSRTVPVDSIGRVSITGGAAASLGSVMTSSIRRHVPVVGLQLHCVTVIGKWCLMLHLLIHACFLPLGFSCSVRKPNVKPKSCWKAVSCWLADQLECSWPCLSWCRCLTLLALCYCGVVAAVNVFVITSSVEHDCR